MIHQRETARQIAERIRKGRPPERPMFISEALSEGVTISTIDCISADRRRPFDWVGR